jgi:hypothetical protein
MKESPEKFQAQIEEGMRLRVNDSRIRRSPFKIYGS